MNGPRWRSLGPYFGIFSVVMACSAGVDDPNATQSQALTEKVSFDCEQTIACKVRQGQLAPRSDLVPQCVAASMQRLGTGPARNQFLTNYGRCALLSLCDYSSCAGTGAHGFGEMQVPSITYNCQQTIACSSAQGMSPPNAELALSDCVAITVGQLDSLSTNDQFNYQNAHARCSTLGGCDFVTCIRQGAAATP